MSEALRKVEVEKFEEEQKFQELLGRVKAGDNPFGMEPVEFKIVVLPEYVSKFKGPFEKPHAAVQADTWAQTTGYVVAVSDMACTDDYGKAWPCKHPKVGDKIIYTKYAGQLVEKDDVTYRIISDKDLCAVEA